VFHQFYRLNDDPFRLTADPSYVFMTVQHREALAGLIHSACTRAGLSILVGEAGTGKTTIIYTLLGLLEKRRFITAICTNPTLTRQEFYDLLLLKLGVECDSVLKSRQLLALQEHLVRNRNQGRPCALIVDEAHRIPVELLEEIRLLLNLETPREKLLEIILVGQPELSDVLAQPEMRQLKQRVSCICKLAPLGSQDVREYIQHRLAKAGLPDQRVFSDPVMQRIYDYTGGIPRVVNTLCTAALQTGFALQSSEITAGILEEAAQDLDLLPGKTTSTAAATLVPVSSMAANGSGGNSGPSNGHSARYDQDRVPLENYASRQRSLKFFSSLMEKWR
jgi:general secretion pathway protein A